MIDGTIGEILGEKRNYKNKELILQFVGYRNKSNNVKKYLIFLIKRIYLL